MKRIMTRLGGVLAVVLLLLPLCSIGVGASGQDDISSDSAYELLNNHEKILYRYLREQIAAVAEGSLESTLFQVDADLLAEWQASGLKISWTREDLGVDSVPQGTVFDLFWEQFSFSKILSALLHDHPFALYWYDKTAGASAGCSMETYRVREVNHKVSVSQLSFKFNVSPSYRAADYNGNAPCVDLQKTKLAAGAAEKAREIVAKYADASDYGKLVGYRDEICALVSYNHDAASDSYTGGYGDPWQLVYVFDGDPLTNVVCEGYAKAFKYLCDLTDFSDNVSCYTVNGTMEGGTGAGAHMWNIVAMEDGKHYLVDVTNSDSGSVGADGGLFLSGAAGSASSGYIFSAGNTNITYVYSQDAIDFWMLSGILSIAAGEYEHPMILINLPDSIVYDGSPLTAGHDVEDVRYLYGGESDLSDQYTMSHVWCADADGAPGAMMADAPKDAGTYWIFVTAKRGAEVHEAQKKVVIAPAVPTYTAPTGLTAMFGQTLRDVKLPEGFTWKDGSLSVGNAGINRFQAIYTPADTKNYRSVEVAIDLTVAKKDISDMIPEMEQFPIYNGRVQTIEAYLSSLGEVGVAYTVSGNQATDVGIYTLTLTGIGNYCGTVTAEWKILPDVSGLEGLSEQTVKESDRAAIEAVKASIKSDAAKAEWADVLANCDALLAALDAAAETADGVDETADTETTDAETTSPERDTEKSGGSKQDIVNLPAGCSITLGGGAALGLILLISCATVLVQKKRTRID